MREQRPVTPIDGTRGNGDRAQESETERIRRISEGIYVDEKTARVGIASINLFSGFRETSEAVRKSGVHRLVDLCCGYAHVGRDYYYGFEDTTKEKGLLEKGIEEYTGVDVVNNDMQGEFADEESQKTLKWSYKKSEALLYLAEQPDNSAHIMMCGLDGFTTQGEIRDWSLEMFKQLKRVVPNGGVMCLQGFIFNNGVLELSSLKGAFPEVARYLPDRLSVKGRKADDTIYEPSQFGLEPVRMTDSASGYKFVDEKLGVDWYFFAKPERWTDFDDHGSVSEETISTAGAGHGMPFYLINKK